MHQQRSQPSETTPASDAALARAAVAGDRGAFDVLFDRHFPRSFSYALAQLDSRSQAEAATAAAFETLARLLPAYRGATPLSAWIFMLLGDEIARLRSRRLLPWRTPSSRRRFPRVLT